MRLKVCGINELDDDASIGVSTDTIELFAIKKDGQIFLYENSCPHLGTSLEFVPNQFLNTDRSLIICSSHGALFEPHSGSCISGPCTGQTLGKINYIIEDDVVFAIL